MVERGYEKMTAPYRYIRKVIAVGHSLMVSLPVIWTKACQVKVKDQVNVEVHPDRLVITVHIKNGSRSK